MRYLIFSAVLLAGLQQSGEQYPGQSKHGEPPAGWFCEHPTLENLETMDPAHMCSCERSCDQETLAIAEDKNCAVFCHADHCHCPVSNMKACSDQMKKPS